MIISVPEVTTPAVITPADGQQRVMTVLRAFARPMVAAIFVIQGYDTFRRPERVASRAE